MGPARSILRRATCASSSSTRSLQRIFHSLLPSWMRDPSNPEQPDHVLPLFIVAKIPRALLSSRVGEIDAGWHCSQAPDEMLPNLPENAGSLWEEAMFRRLF